MEDSIVDLGSHIKEKDKEIPCCIHHSCIILYHSVLHNIHVVRHPYELSHEA